MKVILLAAGLGTRLRPITDSIPKCLVEINGKTLIEHWMDLLQPHEEYEILINTHYKAEMVRQFLATRQFPHDIKVLHESKLLGTAGTLRAADEFLENEPVMLVHADNLSVFSISDFLETHRLRPKQAEITMMLFEAQNPKSCGIVEVDQNDLVVAFHEKVANPPGSLANGAVYILEPCIVRELVESPEITDFSTEVIPTKLGKIYTFMNSRYHRDIGTPASLEAAKRESCLLSDK